MEVPNDYVLNLIRKHLDTKIDALNEKIDSIEKSLKDDIRQLRKDMQNYNRDYKDELEAYNKKIEELEKFKYKMIAWASVIAVLSSYVIKNIL